MIRVVAAIVVVLTAAGCSTSGGAGSAAPTEFPPRPVDIITSKLDPCAMFDRPQQDALGLRKAVPKQASVNGLPSPGCVWLATSDVGYNTQLIPIGADRARSDPESVAIVVNGFGAVRGVTREMTGGLPTCQVTIDAAPGRSVRIQAQATRTVPTDDEMCRLATEAASMVMTTVVRTAG